MSAGDPQRSYDDPMSTVNPAARLPMLRPVAIFRGLRKATLFEIAHRTTEVTYPAGSTVVEEGGPGNALCIVVQGTVEVRRGDRALRRLRSGDYFGEISLIDGQPRSATVVALDDVVLFELSSADFESLLHVPHVARVVMTNLTRIIRETQDQQTLP